MELTRKLLDTSSVTLADQRLVTVICSTGEPDRMGDVIVQNGIDLTAYRKNPVVLWGHSADVPIAKAIEIDVKNGKLQATVQFPPEGDDEDADWVYGKIKAGIVNATSVGFIPKDYEPLDPKQPWGGFKFVKSELLEFSFVSIPANSGCLIVGRSLLNAVDVPMLPSRAKSSGIKDTDLPNEVKIPRNVLEEVFRLAKTPRTMRQKYLARAADPSWKVGAADDLSVIDAEAWDGAAAAKRILDDAGFDGDSPDVAKAARGFLLHDAANPVLRSSYKLPFADIVDGELKAIKSGVVAAKGRLDQTSPLRMCSIRQRKSPTTTTRRTVSLRLLRQWRNPGARSATPTRRC
jgi:HK97 family phage prohead protease